MDSLGDDTRVAYEDDTLYLGTPSPPSSRRQRFRSCSSGRRPPLPPRQTASSGSELDSDPDADMTFRRRRGPCVLDRCYFGQRDVPADGRAPCFQVFSLHLCAGMESYNSLLGTGSIEWQLGRYRRFFFQPYGRFFFLDMHSR